MASCITSKWVSTAPQIRLTVTESSNTSASVKYTWKLEYIASSAANTSQNRSYTAKINGETVADGTYNIDGKKGTYTIDSGNKTIDKTHSAQTISYSCSMAFNLTWSDVYAGTKSANGKFSIEAKPSYAVTYDANGGSGAPGTQTKWYGEALTLSSTVPTRSGWAFMGWGTTASDTSSNYAKGSSYTSNAAIKLYAIWNKTLKLSFNASSGSDAPSTLSATIYNSTTSYKFTIPSKKPTRTGYSFLGWSKTSGATSASYSAGSTISISSNTTLYAVWKVNTYTVTYNANGGEFTSGSVTTQTKTYGESITISASQPTKVNYNFLGWSTSSTATSATYVNGSSFTTNDNTTLYAVWELGYTMPRISNVQVDRCTSSGSPADDGTCALISFDWSCDYATSSVIVSYSGGSKTITGYSGTSGSCKNVVVGSTGTFSIENSYILTITVSDNTDYNYTTVKLPSMEFMIDLLNGGKGVSVGKAASKENTFDVGWATNMDSTLKVAGKATLKGGLDVTGDIETNAYIVASKGFFSNSTVDYTLSVGTVSAGHITASQDISADNNISAGGTLTVTGDVTASDDMYVTGTIFPYAKAGFSAPYTTATSLFQKWKDGANHDIVSGTNDGLSSGFGWAGSSSYATVTTLRGRTCRVSNSSGTSNLSDKNLKKDFEEFTDKHDEFFDNLKPTIYKYIFGSSSRQHFGYIAQEVVEALEKSGLTTRNFGGVNIIPINCRETETDPETGNTVDIEDSADNYLLDKGIKEQHNLIYTEFISMNTWQIQKLKKRVAEQDERIAKLEELITQLISNKEV